ncbi:hypothetical protein M2284_000224 [Rhodococcus sp. LBL1]|uniref:Uncharacterized protein n=1 Tax=Prescottella agglutinans TaxID=1644129 RepID=A0ABT6MFF4_9NOCA|nr:hypothetical protein [Prescottella agglutinans]MDH6283054.1 hypothetical protein [Prescottella agglutinans]MDH6676036.1 hypothetical protein [Rhodococcus sp. LBL1]MDH6681322.1 hypothetical protein [Rhodococcus sp. LBL2]
MHTGGTFTPDPSAVSDQSVPDTPADSPARKWFESIFDVSYIATIWALVVAMTRRKEQVPAGDRRTADLLRRAFMMLAVGDTAHVGFRVLAYARGRDKSFVTWLGQRVSLIGLGEMVASITMTFFYVLTLDAWRVRFGKAWNWFTGLLLASAGVRIAALAAPQNKWEEEEPPQPWSTYRNIPLLTLGVGQAYLIEKDARRTGDRTFQRIGRSMLASYAFYTPVVLFARRSPLVGLLMIPKTIAYVAMALRTYRDFYRHPRSSSNNPA